MKKLIALLSLLICAPVMAQDINIVPPAPRVSLFSTTVDWHGVTGLSLAQYVGKFSGGNASLLKNGLILYYLDAFPCYGEADSVRIWVSPRGDAAGTLRLVCVHAPKEISFAWRNAPQDAEQAETTGILNCPVSGDYELKIDLSKCTRGPDWREYK
ncbi:MAG: hypothetical protein J5608_03030 [Alphaproteobacteria bacterium]|nr:hypothetical protein [Alphaproteobacteria bacterium]